MYDDTVMVDKAYYNKLKEQTTWISVKDRLPEMYVNVLVYTECKYIFIADIVDMSANIKNIVWEDSYGYYLEDGVTHWRTLPEAPESEG